MSDDHAASSDALAALSAAHARLLDEHQQLTRALERAQETHEQLDGLKAGFLSMVSHELRTPLTAIMGYTDLLLKQVSGPLNDRQLQHLGSVRTGATRLLTLISDLLDVSHLEGGRLRISAEPIELGPLIQQAADEAADEARSKGVRLGLRVAVADRLVLGEGGRLVQVLRHLLSNAVKFSRPGDEIVVEAGSYGGNDVCVSVRDAGAGIAPGHLESIWDRFYQADPTIRRAHGGAGLGLAIVKRIVELHGGTVWAESAGAGKGSAFSFTLPLAPVAQPLPALARPPVRRGGVALVVDDHADNRDVLRDIIESLAGLQVVEARDGHEAIEQAERMHPDVIVFDLLMPGTDGFEVARRLRADPHLSSIPLIAVSGLAQPDDRARALQAGADAFIEKPFDAEELAELIRRLVSPVGALG